MRKSTKLFVNAAMAIALGSGIGAMEGRHIDNAARNRIWYGFQEYIHFRHDFFQKDLKKHLEEHEGEISAHGLEKVIFDYVAREFPNENTARNFFMAKRLAEGYNRIYPGKYEQQKVTEGWCQFDCG